jgi:hypothetical protein
MLGRPTTYTPEKAEEICKLVATCVPIHKIAEREGMPAERTIYQWLEKNKDFAQDYTRAREAQSDRHVAETFEIADDAQQKMASVEHARLRVQVRQWAAERMAPKKYGARVRTELTTPEGPIQVADASAKLLDLLNRPAITDESI